MNGAGMTANNMVFASIGERFVASMIDAVIMILVLLGVAVVAGILMALIRSQLLGLFIGPLASLAILAYYVYLPTTSRQGTLGKSIMKIKIVDYNGNKIQLGRSLGRYLVQTMLSQLILGFGYWMAFFNEKHQTLHDMIAKTYVVKA